MAGREISAQNTEIDMNRLGDHSPIIASVIVPVFNGANTITQCLDALAKQTIPAPQYELIVVDDGSTDETASVVHRWSTANPNIGCKLIRQTNQGPAAARNRGAEVAHGELLLFTDADCRPLANWVEAFVAAFGLLAEGDEGDGDRLDVSARPVAQESTQDPIAAAMGTYRTDQRTAAARFAQLEFEERYERMRHEPSIDVVATYSAAFRRTIFSETNGFDPSFPKANNEDVELSYRLSALGHTMIFVPDAIVFHPHGAGWWDYARTKLGRAYWRTIVYKRYPGKALKDSYTPQLLKVQIVLAPLSLLGLGWSLLTGQGIGLASGLFFLLTTLPMTIFALQQRKLLLALAVPWGLWLRSIVFSIGVATAILSGNRLERWNSEIVKQ